MQQGPGPARRQFFTASPLQWLWRAATMNLVSVVGCWSVSWSGNITTIAGTRRACDYRAQEGIAATSATFYAPGGLALDASTK